MPTFLSDPPQSLYLLLFAFAVVAGAIAFRRQDRRSLTAFAVAAGLLLLFAACDYAFESPREQAVRKVKGMVQAANDRNPDAFVANVADHVEIQGEAGQRRKVAREALKRSALWGILKQHNVSVAAWDFDRDAVKVNDSIPSVEIGFFAQGKADGNIYPLYFRATYRKDPDGQYRLVSLATFDPLNHSEPKGIPYFP